MTIVVADVRKWPLNNIPDTDLADNTIEDSIEAATQYVNDVKKADATAAQIDRATQAYAGYLAYLAYSDRQVAATDGAFADGYYTPNSGEPGVPKPRFDTAVKLKHLKDTYERFLRLVSNTEDITPPNQPKPPRFIPMMLTTKRARDL